MLWLLLGFWLFSTALTFLTRSKLRRPSVFASAPKPGEFQRPTAEEGRAIPYVAGTVIVASPNVLWDGDYATSALVESGTTIGYQYYLGVQYGLCMGPIDRVIDLRFDDRVLTSGISSIPAAQVLVVNGTHVNLTHADFLSAGSLADSVAGSIITQAGTTAVTVYYGYEATARTDQLHFKAVGGLGFGLLFDGTVPIPLGPYPTGASLAYALNQAIRKSDPLMSVAGNTFSYDEATGKFSMNDNTLVSFTMYGDSEVLPIMGWIPGIDVVASGGAQTATYVTHARRFFFSVIAGNTVDWTDVATNCHALFGVDPASPDYAISQAADFERFVTDALLKIIPDADLARVSVNAPELFGGRFDEGGVVGDFDVYYGNTTQTSNDYLSGYLGPIPAYRRLCYMVARRPYWGNSAYMKRVAVAVEKCPNELGLTGGKERISIAGAFGDDANPAAVIYELLTDVVFGMGISADGIDVQSFLDAGAALYAQGLGISLSVPDSSTALDLLDELTRHIDGVIFTDPETGKQSLRLVRDDLVLASLPVVDSLTATWIKMTRIAHDQVANVVKVSFTDRAQAFTQRIVQIQNLANVQMLGRGESDTVDFPALTSEANARVAGTRYLATVSYPLARLEITADRSAWRLKPGDGFILNWAPLGIASMVCRVTRIRSGEIRDGAITIEAVEDVDNLDMTIFSDFD